MNLVRTPNAPPLYAREWGDNLVRSIELNLSRFAIGNLNYAEASGFYGGFYDTTVQTAAVINTAYAVTFNTESETNQFGVLSGSHIQFNNRGKYIVHCHPQVEDTAGTGTVSFWLRKNGTDIPGTAKQWGIPLANRKFVASFSAIVGVLSEDYIQLMWSVSATTIRLPYVAAIAPVPAVPSVILNVISV